MPNWCMNKIKIHGNREDIKAIKENCFTNGNFDFTKVVPIPPIIDELASDIFSDAFFNYLHTGCDIPMVDTTTNERYKQHLLALSSNFTNETKVSELIAFIQASVIPETQAGEPNLIKSLSDSLVNANKMMEAYKETGYSSWWGWGNKHWGTSRVAFETFIHNETDTALEFSFDTAWAPANGVYKALCEKYPNIDLRATYYEGGCYFGGEASNEDGTYVERSWSDEEIKAFESDYYGEDYEVMDDDGNITYPNRPSIDGSIKEGEQNA